MLRRLTLPVVLTLTMCIGGFQAWHTDRASVAALAERVDAPAPSATPLLSVRRAPAWLQRPRADAALTAALDAVMAASPPDTCLVVRDNGRVLYSRNATAPLVPASTVKLLTAFASTEKLGQDATFDTPLCHIMPFQIVGGLFVDAHRRIELGDVRCFLS